MDGNLAMADYIVNETPDTNAFWADVYYCMQERGCSQEEAIQIIQPLYEVDKGEEVFE